MPLVTKKNGIRSPKPTASSFDSKRSSSLPLSTVCTSRPAANAPRMTSSPRSAASTTSANTDSTVSRTGSCPLVLHRALEEVPAPSDRAGRERRGEHGDRHERDEQQRLGRGIGCRAEQQRDDQHGPELSDGADRQHVAAEWRVELVGVAQQRDQRAERGRGHRRARQQARDDDAADLEQTGQRVRQGQRAHPPDRGQAQRGPAHALEPDLVAGEEEQEAEPELAEELEQIRRRREPEHVRTDHDAEEQLGHHHGHDERAPRPRDERGQDRRQRGCEEHGEEVARVGQHGPARSQASRRAAMRRASV